MNWIKETLAEKLVGKMIPIPVKRVYNISLITKASSPGRRVLPWIVGGLIAAAIPPVAHALENMIAKRRMQELTARARALVELLIDDTPELQQYPRAKVHAYAYTLLKLNPDLFLEPEVLRSTLKSTLAMGGIDPVFASKVMAKPEQVVKPVATRLAAEHLTKRILELPEIISS